MKTLPCPHCGKPISPDAMLGGIKSERKTKAAQERGRKLSLAWANLKKMGLT